MPSPCVTVLMAVYNGERYLSQAIDSVLAQDFRDFEFLVINDGSTDSTAELLEAYRDPRVRLVNNKRNIGLTASLNHGLKIAHGRYIARMDADDSCEPYRLSRQVQFLNEHPDHVVCGSSYTSIDQNGAKIRRKIKDFNDVQVRWIGQFRTPIDHSTATFRSDVVRQHGVYYNEFYRTAQDFDYWLCLLEKGKGHVLPEPLMQYRFHEGNVTHALKPSQRQNLYQIANQHFRDAWPQLAHHADGFEQFLGMYHLEEAASPKAIRKSINAISALTKAFHTKLKPTDEERRWIARQTAGIITEAIIRNGRATKTPAALFEFILRSWPRFPDLAARLREERRNARIN